MIAQVVDMEPHEFIWSIGDAHIYLNQLDAVNQHLQQYATPAPKLLLNKNVKSIFDFTEADIVIEGYEPNPNKVTYPISM